MPHDLGFVSLYRNPDTSEASWCPDKLAEALGAVVPTLGAELVTNGIVLARGVQGHSGVLWLVTRAGRERLAIEKERAA